MSGRSFAAKSHLPLVFALCAIALPGLCALLLAPDLAQALASVWITLAAILLALLI